MDKWGQGGLLDTWVMYTNWDRKIFTRYMVEGQRKCLHYLIMKTWISSWIASWVPGDIWTLLHNVQELFLCPASFTPPSKAVAQTEQEKHPHLTERTQVARGGKRLAQGPCVDHLPFALLFVYLPTLFPQRIWRYIMKYKIAINIMFSQDKGKYTLENLSFLSWYRPSPFPPPGLSRGCDLCQEHLSPLTHLPWLCPTHSQVLGSVVE